MRLIIFESAFKKCDFLIDPSTLYFYGSTEDYDYDNPRRMNSISFVLEDHKMTDQIVQEIKSTFRYSNSDVNDYIKVRTKFEDYEKDQRPRIAILERSGSKGMKNPLAFNLQKD